MIEPGTALPWRPHDMESATLVGHDHLAVADFNAFSRDDETNARNSEYALTAANLFPELVKALEVLVGAVGDWSRPTYVNGMTAASEDHPLNMAARTARATLARAKGEGK